MNKIETYGLERLKHRTERLMEFLKLEAPAVIIANEICMIVDAAKLYSPEAWYRALRRSEMTGLKFANGFCSQEDCDERRDHEAKDLSDLCTKHIAEFHKNTDDCEAVLCDDDLDDEELQ